NIIPMMQFMAERFLYLPMAGFCLAAGSLVGRLEEKNPKPALALSLLAILGAGALTINRIPAWKNDRTLYAVTAKDSGYRAVRPYYNYLSALVDEGAYAQALPHARKI